ncbi:gamma carbonic anhydrase family protein [Leucobacter sp. M11]|uniref:gamma carbonic anhydrase family protein n=1 Tax=Leucobacter sp. M11 TaxID=2993565 RepID=UPI002D808942|nr:gamma carbonic anhydrase family protein [Leucobacter sp. M11]MEB4616018.1 gamma carbonic anhydrase family protein [Leucobacter sp. M11]
MERLIRALGAGYEPAVSDRAWLAPGAAVIGNVTLGAQSNVWYHAVLRADSSAIVVGERSNFQDGVAVHVDPDFGVQIGDDVSVGHNAVVHGATVEDGCLIGMSATVLNGAVIGAGSLVAAGAVVPQGMTVPPGSLVAGVPAKVIRPLRDEEREGLLRNAAVYLEHTARHRAADEADTPEA